MTVLNDNIFILDERQNTVGVASNGSPFALPYYSDLHLENLEGISTYTFTVPATHREAAKLRINGHIIRQVRGGEYMLFTIKELTTGHNSDIPEIIVFTENSAISELLEDVQRPVSYISTSLESVLTNVLANSHGWTLGYIDYEESRDIAFEEYTTVLEALRFIESEYHLEMYFTVELVGNVITKKKVNMVEQRGLITDVRFEYGNNLYSVTRTEDSSGIISAIIAVGKGDSNNKRVNLTTVAAFDDGNFYKEEGKDWIGSDEALQQWSRDGSHIFGVIIDDEADTAARLKTIALRELKKRIVPSVHYATSVRRLEELLGYESQEVNLGDTVLVLDRTFTPPIAIEGRVQGIEMSYTDIMESRVDLGNYKSITLSTPSEITKLQNAISLKEKEWANTAYKVEIHSSNGLIFKKSNINTILEAKVYRGAIDVTDEFDVNQFKWTRVSNYPEYDLLWNNEHAGGTKFIQVTQDDISFRATFNCEVMI